MPAMNAFAATPSHDHVFLGEGHDHAERRTWLVIGLCSAMMAAEIVGGLLFGSIALVADGLHMSTHAGALLLAALAYRYARRHARDARFTFGTGKLGDLAGFTSAIVLAMIALLIGWEAATRFLAPVPIAFLEAIPIACVGLAVNITSAWLLAGGQHHHPGHHHPGHHHPWHHHHRDHDHAQAHQLELDGTVLRVDIHEDHVPSRLRLCVQGGPPIRPAGLSAEIVRPDGSGQILAFTDRDGTLESVDEIPEPHAFTVHLRLDRAEGGESVGSVSFNEHEHVHDSARRDNNMRAAVIHVMADATVSVLVIVGLLLARTFGWLWMDPLAGIVGAGVIASWAYGLVRDTGSILLDMNPDRQLTDRLRHELELDGDRLTDLHVWRLGPGHLGAVLSVVTRQDRGPDDYLERLRRFPALSHVTVEVRKFEGSR